MRTDRHGSDIALDPGSDRHESLCVVKVSSPTPNENLRKRAHDTWCQNTQHHRIAFSWIVWDSLHVVDEDGDPLLHVLRFLFCWHLCKGRINVVVCHVCSRILVSNVIRAVNGSDRSADRSARVVRVKLMVKLICQE